MRTLLLLCIAVFSFGFAQAQDCTGADHTVLAGNYYYIPSTLTVTAGETIAFQNEGGFHNVNGVSSTLGDTWSNPETFSLGANSGSAGGVCMGTITLNTPGTYQYDCSIGSHAANGMVGTIIVEEAPNTVQVTFNVNMANETTSPDGVFLAGGADFGVAGDNPMSDDDGDDIWTITKTLPVGYTGNYTFLNGNCPDWSCKENINGQDCADGPYADRLLSNITENTTV
ncbi:MAG: cupredoxin domain-containing protein, partial [Flavobacteriales bacterium]